jgi:hypothetical protein
MHAMPLFDSVINVRLASFLDRGLDGSATVFESSVSSFKPAKLSSCWECQFRQNTVSVSVSSAATLNYH